MKQKPFFKIKHAALLVCMVCMLLPSAWSQVDTITITGTTLDSTKVYDGTLFAHGVILGSVMPALTPGLSISTNARYLDPNVGTNKPVVVYYTLSGPGASNYYIPECDTLTADITPRTLYADSVVLENFRIYNGNTDCQVLNPGILNNLVEGDTVYQTVTAQFVNANASILKPINVTHDISGPHHLNYTVVDTNRYYGSISRYPIQPIGLTVSTIKEYDGTDTASVPNAAMPDCIFNQDDVTLTTTANFDSPEMGDNKVVTAHFALSGIASSNYSVMADSIYSNFGRIIPVLMLDTLGLNDEQLVSDKYGFCQGENIVLRYHLLQGEPVSYKVTFPSEYQAYGFAETITGTCNANDSLVSFPLPAACPAGRYTASVTIISAAGNEHVFDAKFTVNMPNSYLVQTFDDVISINNSGSLDGQPNRFKTFQWLHNGDMLLGANKEYYQEIGGLTGEYSLIVNPNQEDEAMVCPKHDFVPMPASKALYLLPSPVVTTTTVKLQGFDNENHTLQVYNDRGILLLSSTFLGRQYTLDLSTLPHGTYLVTVDGVSAKTLKL